MGAAQLATEACDQGFQAGVEKLVKILLQGWVIAQNPSEQKQAVQRFKNGIAHALRRQNKISLRRREIGRIAQRFAHFLQ